MKNNYFLTVSRTNGKKKPRPRLSFSGEWLYDIGFLPGALVQVIPVPGGVDFLLCDENIASYSGLFNATRNVGGNLVRAYLVNDSAHKGAAFVASGQYILRGGLAIGDPLIVNYDYGVIRVRKIGSEKIGFENIRIVTTSHVRRKYTDESIPKIHISGHWLNDIGFTIGSVATADSGPGFISLALQGPDTEYRAFMKYVRRQGLKIVQVRKEPHNRGEARPCIGITGSCVDRAGFRPGDTLACSYENGAIKFQTLDFEKLGFC